MLKVNLEKEQSLKLKYHIFRDAYNSSQYACN